MASTKKRMDFYASDDGVKTRAILTNMSNDPTFNTSASYTSNTTSYPDNLISFVDKHMHYLNTHPSVDLNHYLGNLRLMSRVR